MLWSLIKIVVFIALVTALAFGLTFLIESDGSGMAEAYVVLNGKEYTLNPLKLALIGVVGVIAMWLFFKLAGLIVAILKFINGDETSLSRYFDRNRERKGYEALSQGLMALASGEGRLAIAKATKAEKYLHKPELTDLVTAQAAEMMGDNRKAEEVYKKLLHNEDTRFVGVRGIMKQKLAAGDTNSALQLAERAFAIKPRHNELQDTLLQLQAEARDWSGARKTLAAKLKGGGLPRDVYKRREAVLALSSAMEMTDAEDSAKAAEVAIEANRASPDLVPAAAMAARGFVQQGRARNAVRVIKKAWETHPHPDLAAAFAAIEPNETPDARIARFMPLTRLQPDHRETKLLMAELNLAAENFPEARRALGDLVDSEADARLLAILAAIEKGEGASDAVIRGYLAKALTAPRGPQWVCDKCKTVHGNWEPICSNCGAFDTLSWTTPPQSQVALPAGADMLPLIVGAIENNAPKDEPDTVDVIDPVNTDAEIVTADGEVVDADSTRTSPETR